MEDGGVFELTHVLDLRAEDTRLGFKLDALRAAVERTESEARRFYRNNRRTLIAMAVAEAAAAGITINNNGGDIARLQ